jgi:hypothetical protein
VVLRDYAVRAPIPIPVSLALPCFGSGKVAFVAGRPTDSANRDCAVSFVGQP